MSIFEQNNSNNDLQIFRALIDLMIRLTKSIENITEFSKNELKSISFLQHDKYLMKLLEFYIQNKKHLKRKHAKELITTLESISKVLGYGNEMELDNRKLKLLNQSYGGMTLR